MDQTVHPISRNPAPCQLGEREVLAFFTHLAVERRVRVPVVLNRGEAERLLGQLQGTMDSMGTLLYGSGMRLLECLTLRVKDIDLRRGEIRIRRAKGGGDRVTVLPAVLREPLARHGSGGGSGCSRRGGATGGRGG